MHAQEMVVNGSTLVVEPTREPMLQSCFSSRPIHVLLTMSAWPTTVEAPNAGPAQSGTLWLRAVGVFAVRIIYNAAVTEMGEFKALTPTL